MSLALLLSEPPDDPLNLEAAIAESIEAARPKHTPSRVQVEAGAKAICSSGWSGAMSAADMKALAEGVWRAMKGAAT